MVIATQNPLESQGMFSLYRFMLKIKLVYPTKEEGVSILKHFKDKNPPNEITSIASKEDIL